MSDAAPPDMPLGTGRRFVYLFATPWWRAVWVVGAVVWFSGFTVLAATDPTHDHGFGALSVVPLFTVMFDTLRRSRAIRRR